MGLAFLKRDIVSRIEKLLDIDLSDDVAIVEKQRNNRNGEEYIKAKLLIKRSRVEKVERELERCFGENKYKELGLYPDFEKTCTWWDLKTEDILIHYLKIIEGKRVRTLEVWAFIAEMNNKYYLYIAY